MAPQNLFEAHPDYYWEDENGQRSTTHNFCPSTAPMLELVVQNAAALAKQLYRSSHNYYFWLDDTKRGNCHCAKCRGLSPSDQQLLVMNHIWRGFGNMTPTQRLPILLIFTAFNRRKPSSLPRESFWNMHRLKRIPPSASGSNRSERSLTGC